MRKLLKIFLPHVLVSCAAAAAGGFALYVVEAFAYGRSNPLGTLFFGTSQILAFFLIAWFYKSHFLHQNRHWLFCAPVSRLKTYFLPVLLDLPLFFSFILAEALLIGLNGLIFHQSFESLHFPTIGLATILDAPLDFWSAMVLVSICYMGVMPIQVYSRGRFKLEGKVTLLWFMSAIFFLVMFLLTAMPGSNVPAIFRIAFYQLGAMLILCRYVQQTFFLERRAFQWLTISSLSLTMAIVLGLGLLANQKARSMSLTRRMDGIYFLGKFAQNDGSELQKTFLEADLSLPLLESFLRYHRAHSPDESLIAGVDYDRAILSKTNSPVLARTFELFSKMTLNPGQILTYIDQMSKLEPRMVERVAADVVEVTEDGDLTTKLLDSADPFRVEVGIVLTRYLHRADFFEHLRKNFLSFSDPQKLQAVISASVIVGRQLTLNDFFAPDSREPASSVNQEIQCSKRPFDIPAQLQKSQLGWLNHCLRQHIAKSDLDSKMNLEKSLHGWITWPLSNAALELVSGVFSQDHPQAAEPP